MMKGHVKIELLDHRTGRRKITERDNMLTNALAYRAGIDTNDTLAAEIRQRGIRRREFERFITTLESLPDEVTDFSEDLWGSLVEYLTVYAKDDLRFMLPCEVEITT